VHRERKEVVKDRSSNDSHAEIVARRSLICWLFSPIKNAGSDGLFAMKSNSGEMPFQLHHVGTRAMEGSVIRLACVTGFGTWTGQRVPRAPTNLLGGGVCLVYRDHFCLDGFRPSI
jgi:hypothetical protein